MKQVILIFGLLLIGHVIFAQTENKVGERPPETQTPPPPPPQPIRRIVEEMPRFSGCETMADKEKRKKCSEEKMYDFVDKNLLYPAIAKDNGVEGVVVVRFIVEIDGTLTNPQVVRDIGASCGEEALNVVRMMPNWIPGKLRGKAVRTQFNLPVKFKI